MLKLLRGQEVPKEFVAARKKASKVRVAVAYWGKGAVVKLGLNRSKDRHSMQSQTRRL